MATRRDVLMTLRAKYSMGPCRQAGDVYRKVETKKRKYIYSNSIIYCYTFEEYRQEYLLTVKISDPVHTYKGLV
jgi:hypothetical protein